VLALESERERRERVQIPGAVSPRSEGAFILPAAGKVYKFELLIAGLPTQHQQAQGETFPERKISRCVWREMRHPRFFSKSIFSISKDLSRAQAK
jgi:hypothetical protein